MSSTRVVLPRLARFGETETEIPLSNLLKSTNVAGKIVTRGLSRGVRRLGDAGSSTKLSDTQERPHLREKNDDLELAPGGLQDRSVRLPSIEDRSESRGSKTPTIPGVGFWTKRGGKLHPASVFPASDRFILEDNSPAASEMDLSLTVEGQADNRLLTKRSAIVNRNISAGEVRSPKLDEELFMTIEEGLRQLLLCQSFGITIERKKSQSGDVVATPVFHCPRCLKHWSLYGTPRQDCRHARQPVRGPDFQLDKKGHYIFKKFTHMDQPKRDAVITVINGGRRSVSRLHGNASLESLVTDSDLSEEDLLPVSLQPLCSTLIARRASIEVKSTEHLSPSRSFIERKPRKNRLIPAVNPEKQEKRSRSVQPRKAASSANKIRGMSTRPAEKPQSLGSPHEDSPRINAGARNDEVPAANQDENGFLTNVETTREVQQELTTNLGSEPADVQTPPSASDADGREYTGSKEPLSTDYQQEEAAFPGPRRSNDAPMAKNGIHTTGDIDRSIYIKPCMTSNNEERHQSTLLECSNHEDFPKGLSTPREMTWNDQLSPDMDVSVENKAESIHDRMKNERRDIKDVRGGIENGDPAIRSSVDEIWRHDHEQSEKNTGGDKGESSTDTLMIDLEHETSDSTTGGKELIEDPGIIDFNIRDSASTPSKSEETLSEEKQKEQSPLTHFSRSGSALGNEINQTFDTSLHYLVGRDAKGGTVISDEGCKDPQLYPAIVESETEKGEAKEGEAGEVGAKESEANEGAEEEKRGNIAAYAGVGSVERMLAESDPQYEAFAADKKEKKDVKDRKRRRRASVDQKGNLKNPAVKNVTGRPETKAGMLRKHMLATPKSLLAQNTSFEVGVSKKEDTKQEIPLPGIEEDGGVSSKKGAGSEEDKGTREKTDETESDMNRANVKESTEDVENLEDESKIGRGKKRMKRPAKKGISKARKRVGEQSRDQEDEDRVNRDVNMEGNENGIDRIEDSIREDQKTRDLTVSEEDNETDEKYSDSTSKTDELSEPLVAEQDDALSRVFSNKELGEESPLSQYSGFALSLGEPGPSKNQASFRMTYSTLPGTFDAKKKSSLSLPRPNKKSKDDFPTSITPTAMATEDLSLQNIDTIPKVTVVHKPSRNVASVVHSPVEGLRRDTPVSRSSDESAESDESIWESVSQMWLNHIAEMKQVSRIGIHPYLPLTHAYRFSFYDIPSQYTGINRDLKTRAGNIKSLRPPPKTKKNAKKQKRPPTAEIERLLQEKREQAGKQNLVRKLWLMEKKAKYSQPIPII